MNNVDNFFDEFYSSYSDKIDECYKICKKKRNRLILMGIILLIILLLFLLNTTLKYKDYASKILKLDCLLIFISVVAMGIAIVLRLKKEMAIINEDVMLDIIKHISKDDSSTFESNKRISKENIEQMELFDLKNLKYNGSNCIFSKYNNNNMSFADAEIYYYKDKVSKSIVYKDGKKYLRTTTTKIKKYIFNGCYISATLNKKIADHIYMIPNNIGDLIVNGKIKDYITYKGEEIELEDLELTKKYKVYSDDEVQARYILSLSLMEKINKIDDIFPNKKYIVFKEGRRFVICLEDFKLEDLRKTTLPLIRNENTIQKNLKTIYTKLYNLFDIYNILDLGNDLFVKEQ